MSCHGMSAWVVFGLATLPFLTMRVLQVRFHDNIDGSSLARAIYESTGPLLLPFDSGFPTPTHTQIFNAQLFHTQLFHTRTQLCHTHTHTRATLSHTTSSQQVWPAAVASRCSRVALGGIDIAFAWQVWRLMTSMLLLCGRRGTYDQVARLVLRDAR